MKEVSGRAIAALRIAYWLGIVLDAISFAQMAFPSLGRAMMRSAAPIEPSYIFAIEMGAGLMLGWTVLLFWADRRPVERRAVLPIAAFEPRRGERASG